MQTVPFRECLRSFVDFLEDSKGSCDKIVLIGHNSASCDTHILLRTIQEYSLQLSLSKIVNKSGTTDTDSAIGDMNYLDRSHALLKSFDEIIGDPSEGGVMKKSTAKKLADSGLGFHHLKSLFDTQGEQGLLAILANPPTNGHLEKPEAGIRNRNGNRNRNRKRNRNRNRNGKRNLYINRDNIYLNLS